MFNRPGLRLIVMAVALSLGVAGFLRSGKAAGALLPAFGHLPAVPAAATAIITWEYDQVEPALAFSPARQEYLAVWEDHHWGFGADWDIYGRRLDANGAPIGLQFGISWDGANHRQAPDVAHNPAAGEYLVVWEYEYNVADHDVYAQRVAGDGTLVGSQIAITTRGDFESNPVVVCSGNAGEYLIVWERRVGSDEFAQRDLYAQRLAASGSLIGSQFAVASGALDDAAPAVAFGSVAGQYLVVWQEKQAGSGEYDIRAQRVGADGSLVGAAIGISTWQYDQIRPRIAFNPAANAFLIVWEDHHWAFGVDSDIYGQRVSGAGALIGGNFGIAWDGTQRRESPAVAYQPEAGEFVVAWAHEFSATDHDIYRRRVAADGSLPEGEFVISNLGTHERKPAVAAGAARNALVIWEDDRDKATLGANIYGEVARLWQLSGRVFNGSVGDQTNPMAGVTVQLYCSNTAGSLGSLIATAVTSADGAFGLQAGGPCEYYNLWQVDLPGYASSGAASVGGVVIHANLIQYTYPLQGKTATGNDFWDRPSSDTPTPTRTPSPTSTIPPTPAVTYLTLCAVGDAQIAQESSNFNQGGLPSLRIAFGEGPDPMNSRALVRFDLAFVPSGAVVQSAAFETYLANYISTSPVLLGAHRVTSAWTEGGVTWDNQPSINATPESSIAVGGFPGYKSWSVKSLAQGWINGSLSNHGLELRGPAAGYYSRSFYSREGGQCPRLVLALTSSAPIYTPTPTAPPSPSPTPTQPPAPVSRGVQITGVEINQSVQDKNSSSVPLVAGKRTVVRVHLQTTDGQGSLAGVTGYLYYPYPGGGVYSPINPGGAVTVLANPDRGQLDQSLNFLLPEGAATGSGTLLVRVLPPAGVVFPGLGELQNSRAVAFDSVPAMRLRVVGVNYITGTVTYTPRTEDYARLESWVRAVYPVGTLITSRAVTTYTLPGSPTCGQVNKLLASIKVLDILNGSATAGTRYHGLVFEGSPANYFMEGCCCASGASSGPTGSSDYGWDMDGSYGDWYGGHEIGHGYALCHPGFCAGQTADTSTHCATYPYAGGLIGGPPDNPNRFYGFDTQLMQVHGPDSADMMTYCANLWISDFHYKRIRSQMLTASAPLIAAPEQAEAQERLLVRGTLESQLGPATLDPLLRFPNAADVVERVAGDYTIVLVDGYGITLAQYPFTPHLQAVETMAGPETCSATAAAPSMSVIFELVPWVNGTARVSIRLGAQELGGRNVSANAPVVQVISPNGGEVFSGAAIPVTWSAADIDGDPLTFSLLYSADGGATWTTELMGLSGTSHTLDATLLAGSTSALIRVLATDGVNTAFDQSNAPFTVAGRVPQVSILAPVDLAWAAPDALIILSGAAYDPESGALTGTALRWESDRDGQLGTGALLILAARDLSRGLHQISLRATDPAGMESSATISLTIQQRTFLPIVRVGN